MIDSRAINKIVSLDLVEKSAIKEQSHSLKLTALIHPLIEQWLATPEKLFELAQALGSPLNLLFPQLISQNLASFQSCLNRHFLQSKIYFAHKANKSHSLARQLAVENAFIEVASSEELKHALNCGFVGKRIQAGGPKSKGFLALCLMHDTTISVDNLQELSDIIALRRELKISRKIRILLRVCDFKSDHTRYASKASRFGISLTQIHQAFAVMKSASSALNLTGFAFHVSTTSIAEKALAIENCLSLIEQSFALGFQPTVLNIGGSFKVNYLKNETEWHTYISALREMVLSKRAPITWHKNSFGFSTDRGSIRGSFNSYNYFEPTNGPDFLDEILSYKLDNHGGSTIGAFLSSNGIELWIEPGRSLVDQTGITVASVNSLKTTSDGSNLVCLNMKRGDVCFLDQEIFVDPIILSRNQTLETDISVPVYFTGNLCLENDLIYRHQIFLPFLPEPGDLVVFANTAGYLMDFSSSNSIMQPIAQKASVFRRDGKFTWACDEHYYPWL